MNQLIKHLFIFFVFYSMAKGVLAQPSHLDVVPEKKLPFQAGEWFKFRIHYGFFNASYATIQLSQDTLNDIPVLHAKGYGTTTGLARWFFKVEDHYDTYFDEKKIIPYWFIRDIYEGGYTKNLEINFDHHKDLAHVYDKKHQKRNTFKIEKNAQDLISAFYYLRAFFPGEKILPNQTFSINMFFDNENYVFKMKFLGRETLNTKFGKLNCMKFRPYVQSGRVFREQESVTLWMTSDGNKIPVRLQADLAIGSIKVDLEEFKNLANPFEVQFN
jgi:hypothetical protein